MPNQWPDFNKLPKIRTVRSILLEEGTGISEKTNDEIRFLGDSEPFDKAKFRHHCLLFVPKVAYRYPLLRVVQDNPDYPVTIVADNWPQGTTATSETELRRNLGLVFRSPSLTKVVQQLLELVS